MDYDDVGNRLIKYWFCSQKKIRTDVLSILWLECSYALLWGQLTHIMPADIFPGLSDFPLALPLPKFTSVKRTLSNYTKNSNIWKKKRSQHSQVQKANNLVVCHWRHRRDHRPSLPTYLQCCNGLWQLARRSSIWWCLGLNAIPGMLQCACCRTKYSWHVNSICREITTLSGKWLLELHLYCLKV